MSAASFALVLAGVLLNATAQLLLKAGTNAMPLGLPLSRARAAHPRRSRLLRRSAWWCGSSRFRASPVSIAYPMLSIGYVVNAIAAWWLFGESLSPLRLAGIGVIIVGVFLVAPLVTALPLPFTRPTIDEATIAAVSEVLRSGWITSGPQVQALRERAVRLLRRPAGARLQLRHRRAGDGAAARRHRPGRRGDHRADDLGRHAPTWCARVGATPVFVDVDLDTRNIDAARIEAAITPRTRAIMPVRSRRPAGRPGAASTRSPRGTDCASSRTRRTPSARPGAAGAIGASATWSSFSFHPNKNMTTIEGGALVVSNDDGELARRSSGCASRASRKLARRRHGRREPRRQVQPDATSRRASAWASCAARALQRAPPRARAALFREARTASPGCALPAAGHAGARNWHMFQPLVCFERARHRRASASSQAMHDARHRRRRALPGDASVRGLPAARLSRGRVPERRDASARAPSRCRCSRSMQRRPTWTGSCEAVEGFA